MKFLVFLLFSVSLMSAQVVLKDTLYHIRFIFSESGEPINKATIGVLNYGIRLASWETNTNGYIVIQKKTIRTYPEALITFSYPGFGKLTFSTDTLFKRDTVTITINQHPVELDELVIAEYRIPIIENDSGKRHRKTKRKNPEKFPVYIPGQCIAYEAMQKGVNLINDTLIRKHILAYDTVNTHKKSGNYGNNLRPLFMEYLRYHIGYPTQARDFGMAEKICVSFEFNEQGNIQNLALLKGTSVDLALEVANALARMPRINPKQLFYGDDFNAPKLLKPVRYKLTVNFVLR